MCCNTCDVRYIERFRFRKHFDNVHGEKVKLINIQDPNNTCAACNRIFTEGYVYRNHLALTHNIKIDRSSWFSHAKELPDPEDPSNMCIICNKTYRNSGSYDNICTQFIKLVIPRNKYSTYDKNILPDLDDANLYRNRVKEH